MEKKKKKLVNFKIDENINETLELASNMSGLSKTSIITNGLIKECSRLLKEIEKGKL